MTFERYLPHTINKQHIETSEAPDQMVAEISLKTFTGRYQIWGNDKAKKCPVKPDPVTDMQPYAASITIDK